MRWVIVVACVVAYLGLALLAGSRLGRNLRDRQPPAPDEACTACGSIDCPATCPDPPRWTPVITRDDLDTWGRP
jgi:hypothetical protein